MISKWKINLIAFLISLTLFSVGFSSWQITNNFEKTVEGTITLDSVKEPPANLKEYIELKELICFEYNSSGFIHTIDNNKTVDKTTTVTAPFYLYPQKLQSHFSGFATNSLSLEVILTYKNTTAGEITSLFEGTCSDYKYTAGDNNIKYDITSHEITQTSYKVTVLLADILTATSSVIVLPVNFGFTVDTNYDSFRKAIDNENFEFIVSASLSTTSQSTGGNA